MLFSPPTHGTSKPLHMVILPLYPWCIDPLPRYYDTPTHSISNPLPMVYRNPTYRKVKPQPMGYRTPYP